MRLPLLASVLLVPLGASAAELLTPVAKLHGHRGEIAGEVSYVSRLDLMATFSSSSEDRTVMIWNTAEGRSVFAVEAPWKPWRILLTGDGGQVIISPSDANSSGGENSMALARWDAKTREALDPLELPTTDVSLRLASSVNGKFVAALSGDHLWIWRLADAKLVFKKKAEKKYQTVAFAPDGFSLLAGGEGGVDQLALPKGELKTTYTANKMVAATDLALAPDGKHFAATWVMAPGYHRVGIWQIGKPEIVKEGGAITGSYVSRALRSPAFSKDGKQLQATGFFQGQGAWGVAFSVPELEALGERFAHRPGWVQRTVFGTNADEILTVGKTEVRRHKIATGELAGGYSITAAKENPLGLMALPGDQVLSWEKYDLSVWDVAQGLMVRGYRKISDARTSTGNLLFSPQVTADGSKILFIEYKDLVVLDVESMEPVKRIPLGDDFSGKRLQATPDGSRAVCWNYVGNVLYHVDVSAGTVTKMDFPLGEGERVSAINRELKLAAVVPRPSGFPRLRDLATGELVNEFTSKDDETPRNAARGEGMFSDDGKTLFVWGSGAGAAGPSIWDVESGEFRASTSAMGGLYNAAIRGNGSVVSYDLKRQAVVALDPENGSIEELSEAGKESGYSACKFAVTRPSGHVVTASAKAGLVVWGKK